MNDESHHIFNTISGNTTEIEKGIKRWKEFLLNSNFNFNIFWVLQELLSKIKEYFNDVIYRYSLREAMEDRIVKNIEYVKKMIVQV